MSVIEIMPPQYCSNTWVYLKNARPGKDDGIGSWDVALFHVSRHRSRRPKKQKRRKTLTPFRRRLERFLGRRPFSFRKETKTMKAWVRKNGSRKQKAPAHS